jgi:protein phosphatase
MGRVMPCTITHACVSDTGRTHPENQDRWLADPDLGLYVVADGMADEVPAQLVIDRLPALLRAPLAGVEDLTEPAAADVIQAALAELNEEARTLDTTGSTVVLALIRRGQALIAHLGDSRVYLLRDACLTRLTRDHSWFQEMFDSGAITPEEAAGVRSNGGPTRFIGMWGEPVADVQILDLRPGDRLLMCSDGLTGMLADADLFDILRKNPLAAEACNRLVAEANVAGGEDNITALVIAVTG